MIRPLLLPIGDFAVATSLPARTLRFYHFEGLLVPAEVDEDTGYRAYTFDQMHQALAVVALRRAGVSIRDIRALLDAPDLLPGLLSEQRTVLRVDATRRTPPWPRRRNSPRGGPPRKNETEARSRR